MSFRTFMETDDQNFSESEMQTNISKPGHKYAKLLIAGCVLLSVIIAGLVFFSFSKKPSDNSSSNEPTRGSQEKRLKIPLVRSKIHFLPFPENQVSGMDFVIGNDGIIHMVYSTDNQSFYIQGRSGSGDVRWEKPIAIASILKPRIILTRDGLHVLFRTGYELRHFLSKDGGITWQELDFLVSSERFISNFDVVTHGNTLIVVFTSMPPLGQLRTKVDIRILRWQTDGTAAPQTIASLTDVTSNDVPLRLAINNGRTVHLSYGINGKEKIGNAYIGSARLFYVRSDDSGNVWKQPVEVSLSKGESSKGKGEGIQGLYGNSIELIATAGGAYIFYQDGSLFLTKSPDGFKWSPAIRISPYASNTGWASEDRPIAPVAINKNVRLFWADNRFEVRTKYPSWNPLGGFPWSDENPNWGNNDIFTAVFTEKELQSISSDALKKQIPIEHLTDGLSYTQTIRAQPAQDGFIITWVGVRSADEAAFKSKKYERGIFYTILRAQ